MMSHNDAESGWYLMGGVMVGAGNFIRDGCPSTGVDRRKEYGKRGTEQRYQKKGGSDGTKSQTRKERTGWKQRPLQRQDARKREGPKLCKRERRVTAALTGMPQQGPEVRG